MALLGRDAILKAQDIVTEEVAVPEWGGSVLVRGLDGTERDKYEETLYRINPASGKAEPNVKGSRARLVAMCVVGEDGKTIFGPMDANALGKKSGKALTRVYEVAARLSGLSGDAVDEAGKD